MSNIARTFRCAGVFLCLAEADMTFCQAMCVDIDDWQIVGAIATAGAAVATTASAVVIAVQSAHTRRSAKASEDAVQVAQDTLREAQLARLDARTPRLHVSVDRYPSGLVQTREKKDGKWSLVDVPEGTVFRTPRDEDKLLRVNVTTTIRNDGSSPTELSMSRSFKPSGARYSRRLVLSGAETITGTFPVDIKLSEWIRMSRAETEKRGADNLIFTFECLYRGPNDADVDVSYPVEMRGTVIEPVPKEGDGWRVQGDFFRTLTGMVQPAKNTYYRSRARNEKF